MPTPTSTDVAAKIYSKQLIVESQQQLARIKEFSLDFSEEAKQPGESVMVQLSTANSAGDWNDTTNNFARAAMSVKERSVTLNKRKIAGGKVTPAQMANFHPYWWKNQGAMDARAIGLSFLSEAAALITAANFGDTKADKLNVSLDGFGHKSIAAIRGKAIDDKKLSPENCVLVLNPSFFSQLLGSMDANVYGGREAILKGAIPGLLGFVSVVEWPGLAIPGFVASRAALAFAGRKIAFLGTKNYELVQDNLDPELGLVTTTVLYVDGATGHGSLSNNALFGVGVGADDQLIRLIAAAN